jgi:hypothetical protein
MIITDAEPNPHALLFGLEERFEQPRCWQLTWHCLVNHAVAYLLGHFAQKYDSDFR